MWLLVLRAEIVEGATDGCCATVSRALFVGWAVRVRGRELGVRGTGEAGHRALPTTGKREGISF
jgi:hypothetical protein